MNFEALARHWIVLCEAKDVTAKPSRQTLLGQDLVMYRNETGEVVAFGDRCPHRNVRLSEGKRCGNRLVCQYHGWEFDDAGHCVHIPGRVSDDPPKAPGLTRYATHEAQQLVFVRLGQSDHVPYVPAHLSDPQLANASHQSHLAADARNVAENFLDPFHTPFIHPGIIRSNSGRSLNNVRPRHIPGGLEVEYVTTARQSGFLALFATPIDHAVGRFLLPGIVELEYRAKGVLQFVNTMYLTPRTRTTTSLYFRLSLRRHWLPPRLVFAIAGAAARHALNQDRIILEKQTARAQELGGEFYASTELDIVRRQLNHLYDGSEQRIEFRDLQALI